MLIADPLVLDPAEFLPNGAELDLSSAGFRVLDADFGEADVELQMQREALGELPTDYHPPNTVTALKLGVLAEGEVDLPTAAQQLAQKVGEINTPGTEHWLRREFEVGGNFAGSLGKRVFKATLSGLGGWQRGESPDVALTLLTGAYWYATVEAESEVFKSEEGLRHLIFELAEVLGTSPGLIHIRITNTGEEDWRGLIFAGESRDMAQDETADTTAAMAYEAENLEHVGGTTEAERSGASGGKVIRHSTLSESWSSLLASGTMTHAGVRRIWARVYDPSDQAKKIQLVLKWKSLGAHLWSENRIVTVPLNNGFALVDLGECRPEDPVLGERGWEWVLLARTTNEAFRSIDVDTVYVFPTEQFTLLSESPQTESAGGSFSLVEDNFVQASGVLTGKSAFVGGKWEGAGDTSDFEVDAEEGAAERTATSDADVNTGRYGFLSSSSYEGPVNAGVTVDNDTEMDGRCGLLLRYQDVNNWLRICFEVFTEKVSGSVITKNRIVVEKRVAGTVSVIGSGIAKTGGTPTGTLTASITAAGEISVTKQASKFEGGSFSLSADGDLANGGALDSGKIGIYHAHPGGFAVRTTYDELWAGATEVALDKVCFAGRSLELRSDVIVRQHPGEDKWAALIPLGFLPYAAPSGLEGRKSRFIVVPTQGDLGELADSGNNSLTAQEFDRPAYLFAREAA